MNISMTANILVLMLLVFWLSYSNSISLHLSTQKRALDYDYNYDYLPVRSNRSPWPSVKSNSVTTQRPIIRYWNNFLSSVHLNMPTITWNVTNPLANLFNAGAPNIMETPVNTHNHLVSTSSSKKHKPSKRKKMRKHTVAMYLKQHEPELADKTSEQFVLQSYSTNVNPNIYRFFKVLPMRTRGHYLQDNYYYNKDNYYDEENEGQTNENIDYYDNTEENKSKQDNSDSESDLDETDSSKNYDDNEDIVRSTQFIRSQLPDNSQESVRSTVNSYISDESWSRQSQQTKLKRNFRWKAADKVESRKHIKFFYIQSY